MTTSTITRNGITLCQFEQLTPIVGLYIDHAGGWRLHTGQEAKGFRGYALPEFGRWNVRAWCDKTGFSFVRRGYRTEGGARRALARQAASIEG